MSYLEGVGSVVDVRNGHITTVLCALAVGFTQLEGLCLQSQWHKIIYALPGTQREVTLGAKELFIRLLNKNVSSTY